MELKPGYKTTDIGVIPFDWEAATIGEVAKFSGGSQPPRSTFKFSPATGYVRLIQIRDYKTDAYASYIPAALARKTCSTDDIMIGRYGPPIFQILRGIEGAYNVALIKAIPCERISRDYLFNVLRQEKLFQLIDSLSRRSSGQTGVEMPALKAYGLPLPPIEEQRNISSVLSDVDALLATLDQVIDKKRDLKQAAMQQLLTGKARLPGFDGEWEAKKLEHAGSCLRGVSYRGDDDLSPHDTAFTKRLLRSNNVQNAFVVTSDVQFVNDKRVSQTQILQKNDILICMANGSKALVGKAGLFSIDDGFDYTFGAFMGCFRTDASIADPVFVFSLFQTGRYRDYVTNLLAGSSINNLSPSSIESLEFSFPPYPEQAAIGRALAEMDSELSVLEASRDKTRNIKHAMMQELLTGKTRLA
ncbi:restriction endonuclease subunit S [Alcaligenes sp. Me129]|uniref:restriction endonuclease subunit S n=1 Tax=Alcaligenes sp. Me129 TaxID=3392635 RepID=UPI003D1C1CED